jgi:hypothetical protein
MVTALLGEQRLPDVLPAANGAGRHVAEGAARQVVALAGRGLVQVNGSSNKGYESLLIHFIVLVEVDCAPGVSFEAGHINEYRRAA